MSDTDDLNAWLTDEETKARILDIKRRVREGEVPYYILLFLMDLHDMVQWMSAEEEDEDEDESWKS